MKRLFYILICTITFGHLSAQDLPNPAPNLKTLPAGSYVIAMDEVNQTNDKGFFNLKSYGLVVHLLNNNVKVRWVIKSGKAKDAVDFSVAATRVKPTAMGAANYNFSGGPFVIYAADVAGVDALIDAYNAMQSKANDKIKVYQTTAAVMVDERYNLSGFKPKALLLNNGGNFKIHRENMMMGGITFGMNNDETMATNWVAGVAADLATGCYTFASEAHWNEDDAAKVQPQLNHIRTFLNAGGNALAQCAAVRTYENIGRFHSTGGIDKNLENKFSGNLSSIVYPNADLSYSQFKGALEIDNGGSLKNWQYVGTTHNHQHDHAKGGAQIGAAAAKFKTNGIGGLMFYLGNHKFDKDDETEVLNGIRMYLNAFLTPPFNMSPVCPNPPPPLSLMNLGYKVWIDVNRNNTFEDHEPGADNLKVKLYRDQNGDNQPDAEGAVDSTITSATGVFGFTNLAPGKYIIGVVLDPTRYAINNLPVTTGNFPDNNNLRDNNGVYLANGNEVRTMSITLTENGEPTDDGDGANGNLTLNVAVAEKGGGPLPVGLIQFAGSGNRDKVKLNWSAENEQDLKAYTIEKSLNGQQFTELATVTARNAAGVNSYQHNDVISGNVNVVYYRLKMVATNGRTAYSSIVSIKLQSSAGELQLFPNPVKDQLSMMFNAEQAVSGSIQLRNASGQVMQQKQVNFAAGANSVSVADMSRLPIGSYFVSLVLDNGTTINRRILKQ